MTKKYLFCAVKVREHALNTYNRMEDKLEAVFCSHTKLLKFLSRV